MYHNNNCYCNLISLCRSLPVITVTVNMRVDVPTPVALDLPYVHVHVHVHVDNNAVWRVIFGEY